MKSTLRSVIAFALSVAMLAVSFIASILPMATWAAATARVHELVNGFRQPAGLFGANTLTSLIPTIYEALDVVSREMVGFIPAVTRNSSAERAALNQSILVPITPASTAADNTAGRDGAQHRRPDRRRTCR
jgi:hypothetical protein